MDIQGYTCIAVVGGGGKTSLIFELTRQLMMQGKRVIVGTSTHMAYEAGRPFALWEDERRIQEHLRQYGYCVVGVWALERQKITCPPSPDWSRLGALCDVLLVEADGAKRMALKVPADYEPVIPKEAELVIGVAGLDTLGKSIEECCHRPQLVAELLKKQPDHLVQWEDIAEICCHTLGMRKAVQDRAFKILLNKADTRERREAGERIRSRIYQKLSGQKGLEVEVTSLQRRKLSVVLLAAGNSRRFGEKNKLLYEVNGVSLFERTIETIASLGCGSVTVVTQYEEVEKIARRYKAKALYNPHPSEGIASSIRIGIGANDQAECWMLCVCDQPYMTRETLEGLINCYFASSKGIAAMSVCGKIVNPSIFSREYKEELLSLEGDVGGKQVIVHHRKDTSVYPVSDEKELEDIDYPL